MPFVIRCFIALGVLCFVIAKVITMAYKKEIRAALFLHKEAQCIPLIITGMFVICSWICFLVVLFWGIFSIGA